MAWASEQASSRRPRTYISSSLIAIGLLATPVQADGTMDAWANWALAPKVWKGQTVLAPEAMPRPAGPWLTLRSVEFPVQVHVAPDRSAQHAVHSLRALERAYSVLGANAWPLPVLDGTAGIDLYEVDRTRCPDACAVVAGPLTPSDFDAARTYGLVARELAEPALDACVLSALAQAGLRSVDPAEAASWVRASAELSVWQLTGELGCDDSFVSAQKAPELGLLDADPASGAAGALLLALLSERGSQSLAQNLWEITRQRSQGLVPADRLRSSPDLWEALRALLETQQRSLDDELIELGVARYFAGPAARRAQASYRVLAALPSDAGVPIARELDSARLPAHLHDLPELHDLGSVYVHVQLSAANRPAQLRVWLHGESGPRWSLAAVRLDAMGRERGRALAPLREVPSSFLPLELDTDTASVLLVITQLPKATPDADVRFDSTHGFELIVDGNR